MARWEHPEWRTICAVSDLHEAGTLLDQVTSIWADVLEVDAIAHAADFFDLGGQSLGAIRITAQVREILTDDVPLALIFEEPVLSEYVDALASYAAD